MSDAAASIAAMARRIIQGDIDPVLGCRAIVANHRLLGPVFAHHPSVLAICGFESETDHYPMGAPRERWDPAKLLALDQERIAYTELERQSITEACKEIVVLCEAISR